MDIDRRTVFWTAVFASFVFLVILLSEILLPFVAGAILAYLFDPIVDRMERAGLPRGPSAFLLIALFAALLAGAVIFLAPLVFEQLTLLAQNLPQYYNDARAFAQREWREAFNVPPEVQSATEQATQNAAQQVAKWLTENLPTLLYGGAAVVNFLALMLITPVVAFYLLIDWDRMISIFDNGLPRRSEPVIRKLAKDVDTTISRYLRGQFTVLLLLSAIYIIGLQFIGLNYGVLIGLAAGFISFIPYVGPLVGYLVGGAVAAAQFWPAWEPIAAVIGLFVAGQLIEGYLLTPKIVGESVRLHPVWIIFALFVFGYLLGFLGLLIAVPLAAAAGVLIRFGWRKYKESEFYRG